MDKVQEQYEAYPYPERNPEDEKKRLIEGSPSNLLEIDHFLFNGRRTWKKPFKVLFAGGGTGDGLIMLAQQLSNQNCPADITYLDMSRASRKVAEARAKIRGLTNIRFETGSLLDAQAYGKFDYIDCCGVLHHLENPTDGIKALAAALKPEGGMGLMVYAPYGRSGVYPLQEAFAALRGNLTPEDRLKMAKAVLKDVPPSHPFLRNQIVTDHKKSDAGFYDLLLHSLDRPYDVQAFNCLIRSGGLDLVGFVQPAQYDLARYFPKLASQTADMSTVEKAAICEKLRGQIKMHIAYVAHQDRAQTAEAKAADPMSVPQISGSRARIIASQIARKGKLELNREATTDFVVLPKNAAPLISSITGTANLQNIAQQNGIDWFQFAGIWSKIHKELHGFGLLHYSKEVRQ